MRSIHADLQTAQESLSATPYIYICINSVDYSSRLLQLEHHEESYRERATIVLDNHDLALNDVDFVGEYFEIGYGHNTASGNRYSLAPGLWVKSQQFHSQEGKLVVTLLCEGMWMLLREIAFLAVGAAPRYTDSDGSVFGGTQTIYTLLGLILTEAGISLDALGGEDDGIINAFKPFFSVNYPDFENAALLLYRLICMTKCYLRPEAGKAFKVIYPQGSDVVKESYYSDQAHYFFSYVEKNNICVPNDIKVFWGRGDDGIWSEEALVSPGSAEDAISIAAYTRVRRVFLAPSIQSKIDADNRASAILTRIVSERLAGNLLIPHDASVELYDRVKVVDSRGL